MTNGTRKRERDEKQLVERGRRGTQEAARDREMLCWVGRLRVVSSEELSLRFGVSEQRINTRVRRLLEAGLLGQLETWRSERRLVFLSRPGAGRVGMPLRRPPQPEMDVERELMLGRVVALIETRDGARVLTQREARQAERATGRPHTFSLG